MTEPVVLLERLPNHIALVTLNRPDARNAISPEVAQALDAIVAETEADPDIWAVVLAASGEGVFCAGADLKAVAAGRGTELFTERNGFAGFVYAERGKPWIAAVHGKALAGGLEIMLACDMAVASEEAEFGLPEVSRGIIAAAGGLYRLPRVLPRPLAIELALTADPMNAADALRHGLVNRVVPTAQVRDAALALAARVVRNAPLAVRESLHVARQTLDYSEAEMRTLTQQARNRITATEDAREGPRAFVEKRPAQWKGI
ncbi:MAG: enoyl-CoA hydratase-related protein [Acidovorax sp.]